MFPNKGVGTTMDDGEVEVEKQQAGHRKKEGKFFLTLCKDRACLLGVAYLLRWLKTVSSTFQDVDFDGS